MLLRVYLISVFNPSQDVYLVVKGTPQNGRPPRPQLSLSFVYQGKKVKLTSPKLVQEFL